jgi:hypothetical protein
MASSEGFALVMDAQTDIGILDKMKRLLITVDVYYYVKPNCVLRHLVQINPDSFIVAESLPIPIISTM